MKIIFIGIKYWDCYDESNRLPLNHVRLIVAVPRRILFLTPKRNEALYPERLRLTKLPPRLRSAASSLAALRGYVTR